jgi:hypothetical protein
VSRNLNFSELDIVTSIEKKVLTNVCSCLMLNIAKKLTEGKVS